MDDAMNYNIEQTSESVETSIREENAVQQGSVETGEEESTLNNNTQAPKQKKKIGLIIGAISIVIAMIIAAVVFAGGSEGKSTSGKGTLFKQGLLSASSGDKWGYIDKTGSYVINPQFDAAWNFADNGLARVLSSDKWGYIDKTGSYVINPQFVSAWDFADNGLARVQSGDKWGYIDKTGAYVIKPQFDWAYDFGDNGFACVESGDKWGYIDKAGSYVIKPQFDEAYAFEDGVAVVKLGEKYALIDMQGKYIVKPIYDNMGEKVSSGLVSFADKNGKVGYLNTSGEEIVPAQFDYSYSNSDLGWAEDFYDDGYTIIRMGDARGVIDKTGKYIINPQFDSLRYGLPSWWMEAFDSIIK